MTDKSEKAKSQCNKILGYLKTHNQGITAAEAVSMFNCYRLGGRIHDLRSRGYDIKTITETKKNEDGHAVNYARYVLG